MLLRTPYKLAFGVVRHFDTLLVQVTDTQGRSGVGEMNGYLKQAVPLLKNPPRVEAGAMRLDPGYRPELDAAALERVAVDTARFEAS